MTVLVLWEMPRGSNHLEQGHNKWERSPIEMPKVSLLSQVGNDILTHIPDNIRLERVTQKRALTVFPETKHQPPTLTSSSIQALQQKMRKREPGDAVEPSHALPISASPSRPFLLSLP